MADRPVCGFRWKRHHENHKQLCRVLQAQLHIGYMSHHSKQLASRRSVSLMLAGENRCTADYFICQDLQTHKQTNQHARLGGSRCTLFIHSRQACMKILRLFKRFRALQARQEFTAWETTWSHCLVTRLAYETQSNILFIPLSVSDTKFQGRISVSIFNHKATPLKDKDGNICQQISWKHLNQH